MERKINGDPEEQSLLDSRLNKLPFEVQTTISAYSSFFLEQDVFDDYKNDPLKIAGFKRQLQDIGFDDEAIDVTMRVIGFTEPPPLADNR